MAVHFLGSSKAHGAPPEQESDKGVRFALSETHLQPPLHSLRLYLALLRASNHRCCEGVCMLSDHGNLICL